MIVVYLLGGSDEVDQGDEGVDFLYQRAIAIALWESPFIGIVVALSGSIPFL